MWAMKVLLCQEGFVLETFREGTWFFRFKDVLQWKHDEERAEIVLRTRLEPNDPYIVEAYSKKPERTEALHTAMNDALFEYVWRVEDEMLMEKELKGI